MNCPQCNAPMVKRCGTFGEFYGCSTYPQCKGTRQVTSETETEIEDDETGLKQKTMKQEQEEWENDPNNSFE